MAIASPFFSSLPLAAHGLEWIDPPLPLVHPFDDSPPAVLDRSIDSTGATLGQDRSAYSRLMAPLVRDWEKLAPEILQPMLHLPSSPIALARFGLKALWPATSLAKSVFREDRARALFAGVSAHSIVALEKLGTSAIGLVMAIIGHVAGWPLPRGGSQQIAEALASYFRSLGGIIETNARVENIDHLPKARAVLFDLTPRQVAQVAANRLPEKYKRALNRFSYGPGAFKIDWALAGPYSVAKRRVHAHRNVASLWQHGRNKSLGECRVEWPSRGEAFRIASAIELVRQLTRRQQAAIQAGRIVMSRTGPNRI